VAHVPSEMARLEPLSHLVLVSSWLLPQVDLWAWEKEVHRVQTYQTPFWRCAKASNREMFNYCKTLITQRTPDGEKDMMNSDTI
jgi:hypothetical protein